MNYQYNPNVLTPHQHDQSQQSQMYQQTIQPAALFSQMPYQQFPTSIHPPMFQQLTNQLPANTQMPINTQYYNNSFPPLPPTVMQSTGTENLEAMEDSSDNESQAATHEWQVIKKRKRSLKEKVKNIPGTSQITTTNKFAPLTNEDNETNQNSNKEQITHKPPPIFIYGVIDITKMNANLANITEQETFQCKALQNDTVKINTKNPETYRKLIQHLNDEKIVHHTYQLKENRAYRVVIRNLHYSIPTADIKQELETKGHTVRNILNIRHRVSKLPLMMFYVDLEPSSNNKEIYNIEYIGNMKITIEPPHKKKTVIQCLRCQLYGHSKAYCTRPYKCVKCGGDHKSTDCKKLKDTPATCALCGGKHTANWKGCTVYRNLQSVKSKQSNAIPTTHNNAQTRIVRPSTQQGVTSNVSYASNVSGPRTVNQPTDLSAQLTSFLNEFKVMFTQLINQNGMILNMLNSVITAKLNNGH